MPRSFRINNAAKGQHSPEKAECQPRKRKACGLKKRQAVHPQIPAHLPGHDSSDGRRNKSKDIPLISMQEEKKKKKSKTRPLSDVGCGEPDSEQN